MCMDLSTNLQNKTLKMTVEGQLQDLEDVLIVMKQSNQDLYRAIEIWYS